MNMPGEVWPDGSGDGDGGGICKGMCVHCACVFERHIMPYGGSEWDTGIVEYKTRGRIQNNVTICSDMKLDNGLICSLLGICDQIRHGGLRLYLLSEGCTILRWIEKWHYSKYDSADNSCKVCYNVGVKLMCPSVILCACFSGDFLIALKCVFRQLRDERENDRERKALEQSKRTWCT